MRLPAPPAVSWWNRAACPPPGHGVLSPGQHTGLKLGCPMAIPLRRGEPPQHPRSDGTRPHRAGKTGPGRSDTARWRLRIASAVWQQPRPTPGSTDTDQSADRRDAGRGALAATTVALTVSPGRSCPAMATCVTMPSRCDLPVPSTPSNTMWAPGGGDTQPAAADQPPPHSVRLRSTCPARQAWVSPSAKRDTVSSLQTDDQRGLLRRWRRRH